jgi:hypothetical protein
MSPSVIRSVAIYSRKALGGFSGRGQDSLTVFIYFVEANLTIVFTLILVTTHIFPYQSLHRLVVNFYHSNLCIFK